MDVELGAIAACERSEHAASVTSLAVHCIGVLGAMILILLKLYRYGDLRIALIWAFLFLLA